MSRHGIALGKDDNCVIGFDPMLETLFFMTGKASRRTGEPVLWLGGDFREFLDPALLEGAIRERSGEDGFRIDPSVRESIRSEALRHFDALGSAGDLSAGEVEKIRRAIGARARLER